MTTLTLVSPDSSSHQLHLVSTESVPDAPAKAHTTADDCLETITYLLDSTIRSAFYDL